MGKYYWKMFFVGRADGKLIECCNDRDRFIASGAPYIPPSERQGHRFYKADNESKKAALAKANAARIAKFDDQIASTALSGG